MSSGLTLGQARAQLPTAALSNAANASATTAAAAVNAATSSIFSFGDWKGTVALAVFQVVDNVQITLPRDMLSILGAAVQGVDEDFRAKYPVLVQSEWYAWVPGGSGIIANPPYDVAGFLAQGDGFVVFRDLPSAGTIKVYNSTTESTGTINIRGYSGGSKVFTGTGSSRVEGENVAMPTTASSSTTTTTTWDSGNSLYGIVKPATNGVLNFYHVAADATETIIGSYEPGELNPSYRRYWCPKRCNDSGQAVCIVARRHVDVVVDNDQIIPGNLPALEMALMAVNFRRKGENDRFDAYMGMAMRELNAELEKYEAESSYGVVQIDPSVSMGQYLNLV